MSSRKLNIVFTLYQNINKLNIIRIKILFKEVSSQFYK